VYVSKRFLHPRKQGKLVGGQGVSYEGSGDGKLLAILEWKDHE
jgi:hypothetical protein